jgi:HEPN domain-containing protein
MNAPRDLLLGEAGRWLRYAEEDLDTSMKLAADRAPARQVCALAQQAAEKAIKAGLVSLGIDPPKTHNLGRLKGLLEDDWSFTRDTTKLGALTEWAVAGRYPGDWEEPTSGDVQEALRLASLVVDLMAQDLASRGASSKQLP